MSAIQISALESKYLAMFKKYKAEQKLKNKWVQSYQNEYNQNLQHEIELKRSEVNLLGFKDRNRDLLKNNEELTARIQVTETQNETLKDEKSDLLAKLERKNRELESTKMTLENVESHNEQYTRQLRGHIATAVKRANTVESIKQMEIEDYVMQIIRMEAKINKYELEHRDEYVLRQEKERTIREKDAMIAIEKENVQKEKSKIMALEVDIEMLKKDLEEKELQFDIFKNEKELFKVEQQQLVDNLDEYEKLKMEKEQRIKNATILAGKHNDVNSVGIFEKKIQTYSNPMKSQGVQTFGIAYQNLFKEGSSHSSTHTKLTFTKATRNLHEFEHSERKSVLNRSISTNLLETKVKKGEIENPMSLFKKKLSYIPKEIIKSVDQLPSYDTYSKTEDPPKVTPQKPMKVSIKKLIKQAVIRY